MYAFLLCWLTLLKKLAYTFYPQSSEEEKEEEEEESGTEKRMHSLALRASSTWHLPLLYNLAC